MPLRLSIENETSLPDGGPISYTLTGKRGMDIGRDQYLDWVLPDPTRVVSGKHCEIRYRDGAYWLNDVSTNGTFVNNSEQRVQGMHRLQNGDRVEIGRYIISVVIEGEENGGQDAAHRQESFAPDSAEVWQVGGDVAPPINPRDLRTPKVAPSMRSLDVLDWASDIPQLSSDPFSEQQSSYAAAPAPLYTPPPSPMPTPARPLPAADSSAWDVDALLPPRPSGVPAETPPPSLPKIEPEADWVSAAMPTAAPPETAPVPAAAERVEAPPAASTVAAVSEPEPPPTPAPPVQSARPRPSQGASANDGELIRRFAAAAGIPDTAIAARDAGALMEQLGTLIKTTAENLQQLHSARAQSKGIMRSANQTLIQATDNNPLRFSPTTADALKIMFGPPTSGYLDARRTVESSFNDLKQHQMMTFTAMQEALRDLFEELDPKNVTAASGGDKGGVSLLGSKKAKYWDLFVTRWQAKVGKHERGMLGVFMQLFAEAYDKQR